MQLDCVLQIWGLACRADSFDRVVDRIFELDGNGGIRQFEGGYTDYVFPKEGETEPSPKRSYSKAFEPFGWVIGTGNYTDYIDDQVASIEKDFSSYVTGRMTLFVI